MGTPAQMYDEKGKLTWQARLDIYGNVTNFEGSSLNACPFRYQGQYEDVETGLYYNRFRYYSPDEGMYISQDPIRLQGGKRFYGYVKDCNKYLDVFGHEDIWFRCLRIEDIASIDNGEGIIPKDPISSNTPLEHVLLGSTEEYGDQYISLTKDRGLAENWARRNGTEVAEIDLDKISNNKLDLTTGDSRKIHLGDASLGDPDIVKANRYAKNAQELLVEGPISNDAIPLLQTIWVLLLKCMMRKAS